MNRFAHNIKILVISNCFLKVCVEEYKNQCTTEFSTSCQTEYNTKVRYLDFEIATYSLLICISARLNMKNCARRRTIKSATQNMIR